VAWTSQRGRIENAGANGRFLRRLQGDGNKAALLGKASSGTQC